MYRAEKFEQLSQLKCELGIKLRFNFSFLLPFFRLTKKIFLKSNIVRFGIDKLGLNRDSHVFTIEERVINKYLGDDERLIIVISFDE